MNPASDKSTRFTGNLLLPLSILLICGVIYMQSLEFPEQEDVGPAAVPLLWMFFIFWFCAYLVVQAARRLGHPDPEPGQLRTVFAYASFVVLYLMVIESAGYFASTLVFLSVSMFFLGYRKPFVITVIALGWLLFSYGIFYKLLYIPLPVGPLLNPWVG